MAIEGYEMLKGLEGVATHEHREWIPIIGNDQNMERLAVGVRRALVAEPACHAFLLERHGLYTWGQTLSQAARHIEILEFLLEAVGRAEAAAMAIIKIPAENRTLTDDGTVRAFLAARGIDYERWTPKHPVGADASTDEVLAAYAPKSIL